MTKHREALLEGLGLSAESNTVNCAAVKPDKKEQEHTEILDVATRKLWSSAATLTYISSDSSYVQYAAKVNSNNLEMMRHTIESGHPTGFPRTTKHPVQTLLTTSGIQTRSFLLTLFCP